MTGSPFIVKRIYLSPDAPLPCQTAAHELAQRRGARVIASAPPGTLQAGDVVLAVGSAIDAWPAAAARVPAEVRAEEWELVAEIDGAGIFAGSTPRNV
jgi:hypothetical protein